MQEYAINDLANMCAVSQRTQSAHPHFTLRELWFYIYEDLIWHNMSCGYPGDPTIDQLLAKTPLNQSEDYWFLKAAEIHPMRTFDPEDA